jgi:hypothetical protein
MPAAVVGHGGLVSALEASQPPVVLLTGPQHVGKRTIAAYLAQHMGVQPTDYTYCANPLADSLRGMTSNMLRAPFGEYRYGVIRLDGARPEATGVLLKSLEEPPPSAMYVLLSSTRVPDTIASRAARYSVGLLSANDVARILNTNLGFDVGTSVRAARVARGQVHRALQAVEISKAKIRVLNVLRAVSDMDAVAIEDATVDWGEREHLLLVQWLSEALSGSWSTFSESDSPLTRNRQLLRRMLVGMRYPAAPQRAVRAVLLALVTDV